MGMATRIHDLEPIISPAADFAPDVATWDAFSFLSPAAESPALPLPTDPAADSAGEPVFVVPGCVPDVEAAAGEDTEGFSDMDLKFISRLLMEEDMDEKFEGCPEHPALLEVQKPFLEILQESTAMPPSLHSPSSSSSSSSHSNGDCRCVGEDPLDPCISAERDSQANDDLVLQLIGGFSGSPNSSSSRSDTAFCSSRDFTDQIIRPSPSPGFAEGDNLYWDIESLLDGPVILESQFVEREGNTDLEAAEFSPPREAEGGINLTEAGKEENQDEQLRHRGRKHLHCDDPEVEQGRCNKQSAPNPEVLLREMFDEVLLCDGDTCSKGIKQLREALRNETIKHKQACGGGGGKRGLAGTKGRAKRHPKKELFDLTTLLMHCAQAVASDDQRTANELLKQIRQHSSPKGDAEQRLAHYFANGLEARLGGTGSHLHKSYMTRRIPSMDVLKAYQLYLAACPLIRISHFFTNQTILSVTKKAKRVHIIDYGIYYGFQFPCLIKQLGNRAGGPPMLRITGIDLPLPGFRASERVEETGRRLSDYAKSFGVPFEYQAITAPWEEVHVGNLNLDDDELLIVISLCKFKFLMDESVIVNCPRDAVLRTIRSMNPAVFIHGVINGNYNAPFFTTRFREALFYYSTMFDMLETTVPREDEHRLLLEDVLFGMEAINVISCEGFERWERPETYKQWQARVANAGFKQMPLNPDIVKKSTEKVKKYYHKDFDIDVDNRWLLQGWKGRIVIALSNWKANSIN